MCGSILLPTANSMWRSERVSNLLMERTSVLLMMTTRLVFGFIIIASFVIQLTAVTCSFCGQTRPSASEVSPSRLLSSGTHFHLASTHRSTVADSSDQSWKPIFSDKPITLHDSSENNSLKSVTVTVTVTLHFNVLVLFFPIKFRDCDAVGLLAGTRVGHLAL